MSEMKTVTVPRELLIGMLTKARIIYVQVAEEDGLPSGPEDECWGETQASLLRPRPHPDRHS